MHRIRFKTSGKNDILCSAEPNKTLLAAAQEAGVVINAPCGGKGTCGKCLVRIESELKNGSFKACETSVDCEITVYLDHSNLKNTLLEDAGIITTKNLSEYAKFAMAFDIGTTTIVGYLIDMRMGEIFYTTSILNPQISFGADVITRLNYAKENGGDKLTELLRSAINSMIEEAVAHTLININQIQLVCVVGNTCMHHFFHGISTDSLCQAPVTFLKIFVK